MSYPIATCPDCDRRIKVAPGNERMYRHDDDDAECPGSGRRVDLYGSPTTEEVNP